MQYKAEKVSIVASMFRKNYTVESLNRIHRVTGADFPIDGDLWKTGRGLMVDGVVHLKQEEKKC